MLAAQTHTHTHIIHILQMTAPYMDRGSSINRSSRVIQIDPNWQSLFFPRSGPITIVGARESDYPPRVMSFSGT